MINSFGMWPIHFFGDVPWESPPDHGRTLTEIKFSGRSTYRLLDEEDPAAWEVDQPSRRMAYTNRVIEDRTEATSLLIEQVYYRRTLHMPLPPYVVLGDASASTSGTPVVLESPPFTLVPEIVPTLVNAEPATPSSPYYTPSSPPVQFHVENPEVVRRPCDYLLPGSNSGNDSDWGNRRRGGSVYGLVWVESRVGRCIYMGWPAERLYFALGHGRSWGMDCSLPVRRLQGVYQMYEIILILGDFID
jgi:hypothetical protein